MKKAMSHLDTGHSVSEQPITTKGWHLMRWTIFPVLGFPFLLKLCKLCTSWMFLLPKIHFNYSDQVLQWFFLMVSWVAI